MNDTQEPEWVEVWDGLAFPGYLEEIDVKARPGSQWQYRHRPASHTGEVVPEWRPGPAPKSEAFEY